MKCESSFSWQGCEVTLGCRTANICQENSLQRMHLFPDKIKDSPLWLYFMQKLFISAASQKIEKKATLTFVIERGARSWIGFLVSCLYCEEKAREGGITLSKLWMSEFVKVLVNYYYYNLVLISKLHDTCQYHECLCAQQWWEFGTSNMKKDVVCWRRQCSSSNQTTPGKIKVCHMWHLCFGEGRIKNLGGKSEVVALHREVQPKKPWWENCGGCAAQRSVTLSLL